MEKYIENNMETYSYSQLKSVIKNYWNDENSPYDENNIESFVYDSYKDNTITGEQYDLLLCHLENGFDWTTYYI